MVLQTDITKRIDRSVVVTSGRVTLADNLCTTVHFARYIRGAIKPHVVIFDKPTKLLDWCTQHHMSEAINASYFVRATDQLLGEAWLAGHKQKTLSFGDNWQPRRGSVYLSSLQDGLELAPRDQLPHIPKGDLLQAGPMLVRHGVSTFLGEADPEGFLATADQHDEYINGRRHPRAAIACNDNFVWTVTVDGRAPDDAGMLLEEFAELLLLLGAEDALNLDGGRSATHISNGHLLNKPRSDFEESRTGFPVYSALTFEKII